LNTGFRAVVSAAYECGNKFRKRQKRKGVKRERKRSGFEKKIIPDEPGLKQRDLRPPSF
jgi:hypothetical protein